MNDQNKDRECWWAHLTFRDVPYDAFSISPAEALKTLRNGILHDQIVTYDLTWFDIVIREVTPIRLVPGTFFKNGETYRQLENAAV
jgi:hypothetical protein